MITRRDAIKVCDGLNNTAGKFQDATDRTFEYWVLVALRIIIHILLGNLAGEKEE